MRYRFNYDENDEARLLYLVIFFLGLIIGIAIA